MAWATPFFIFNPWPSAHLVTHTRVFALGLSAVHSVCSWQSVKIQLLCFHRVPHQVLWAACKHDTFCCHLHWPGHVTQHFCAVAVHCTVHVVCFVSDKRRACRLASGTHDILFLCTVTVYCPCYLLYFHQAQQFILQVACMTGFIFLHWDCTLSLLRVEQSALQGACMACLIFFAQWPYAVPSVLFCFHRV